jgi:DNA polymerase III alpha subunit
MKTTQYSEIVFDADDIADLLMRGNDIAKLEQLTVDRNINLEELARYVERPDSLLTWKFPYNQETSITAFDLANQANWHMPDHYKQLDIAEHILSLCNTDTELQRCGHELLLYQERNLFDLLRYLKYLVDTMRKHQLIWGVGRGSSVASYVLYKLGIHRIDSMFYDLDPGEFLR